MVVPKTASLSVVVVSPPSDVSVEPPGPVESVEPPGPVESVEPPGPVESVEPPGPVESVEPPGPVESVEPPGPVESVVPPGPVVDVELPRIDDDDPPVVVVVVGLNGAQSISTSSPAEKTRSAPKVSVTVIVSPSVIGPPENTDPPAWFSTSRIAISVAELTRRSESGCSELWLRDTAVAWQTSPRLSAGTSTTASTCSEPAGPLMMVSMGIVMSTVAARTGTTPTSIATTTRAESRRRTRVPTADIRNNRRGPRF